MLKVFILFLVILQTDVPLRSNDTFECKLNLSFRTKNYGQPPVVDYGETVGEREKRLSNSPLPYLKINLTFLQLLPEEVRMQVLANDEIFKNKKITQGEMFELDLGFTDDIKDKISPNEYVIYTQTKDRKPVSKITISFNHEGEYFVNGVKRGKI